MKDRSYNGGMKTGVVWEDVKTVAGSKRRLSGFMLATVFLLLAVSQLFTFEDFPAMIGGLWETSGTFGQNLLAAAIVTTEVFALPALIGMSLTRDMIRFSRICGAIAAGLWVLIAMWQLFTGNAVTVSMLGATVSMPAVVTLVGAVSLALVFGWWLRLKR